MNQSAWEWVKFGTKVLTMAATIFIYGEHQLSAVNTHAQDMVATERRERREDLKQLDDKITKMYEIMLRWDREDRDETADAQ